MKRGDTITVVIKTPWATTEEELTINKITATEIFVDTLGIPFNKKTGYKVESFPGSLVYIKEIIEK